MSSHVRIVLTELLSLCLVLAKTSARLHCPDELCESVWNEAEFGRLIRLDARLHTTLNSNKAIS